MRPPFIHGSGTAPTGFVPVPAHLQKLDQFSSELVNGDDGGTWVPATPLVVGAVCTDDVTEPPGQIDLTSAGSLLSGSIETVAGNTAQPTPGRVSGLVINESAGAPAFEATRGRIVVVPFTDWVENSPSDEVNEHLWAGIPLYHLDPAVMAPRAQMPPAPVAIHVHKRADTIGAVLLPQRAFPRGSRIVSVQFKYQIGRRYLALPARVPQFRVVRMSGVNRDALHTVAGSYISGGWLPDSTAATPSAYWNRGGTRSITYVANQNNATIDSAAQHFAVEWMDDDQDIPDGAPGNAFLCAIVTIDSIDALRPE